LLGGAAGRGERAAATAAGDRVSSCRIANSDGALSGGISRALAEAGYVENKNVAIEYRYAEGHYDRLPSLTADLMRRQAAVLGVAARQGDQDPLGTA
jgi:putative tryptophan/tyrosine transport system substrate-binding protein